jgi:serine/threonine protein kinase
LCDFLGGWSTRSSYQFSLISHPESLRCPHEPTNSLALLRQLTYFFHYRTHKAQVEQDFITGRKLINQYEIIDEIGRGVHGKVKLARSLQTQEYVAIKIIQRFSKKRRLGRVTVSPEDKTKREIAILKKIRHPNVVGLIEVIDDPELKKIYMVLEHVELGEIVWRRKGIPKICLYERRRIEREMRGEEDTGNDEKYFHMIERRRRLKEMKKAKLSQLAQGHPDYWSLEHGNDEEDPEMSVISRQTTRESYISQAQTHASLARSNPGSQRGSRATSRATSRAPTAPSSRAHTPLPTEFDIPPIDSDNEDDDVGHLQPLSSNPSSTGLEGTMYGSYLEDPHFRGRSPSMADSIISHMSSVDGLAPHDAFEDDYSYVPCFTLDQARSAFRDTVLGLEYLHYEGIVHRDIKPANLLWTKDHRVKISDFGVSYFGRPIREGETEENISEADATDFDDDLELAKTVGTPAFFAPELCYTDLDIEQPKITEQIDVWSLGITLYCLIFARIPFMAEDEYQLFKAIAKEEIYIPRKRLKAVDPATPTANFSKRMGPWDGPYRDEIDLAYEEIDDELYDLLRRMLMKDPAERMKLREVKRHPWTLHGIENIIGWLDDTDPSRKTAGRRIEVDKSELERAVVPITFLERARSTLKKTLGKVTSVMRSDRSERTDIPRKRATSNATSSGAENSSSFPPLTPVLREFVRRASLRGDESYFSSFTDNHHKEPTEHPLAQSQTASPDSAPNNPFSAEFSLDSSTVGATPKKRLGSISAASDFDARPGPPERTISGTPSIATVVHRGHSYSRSVNHMFSSSPPTEDECPRTPGLFTDHMGHILGGTFRKPRGRDYLVEIDEGTTSRARSVDRGLFVAEDKHASPSVAMSTAVAPGHFEHPRPSRSVDTSPVHVDYDKPLPSPLFFQPYMVEKHFSLSSASTPNVTSAQYAASILDDRPATANRTPEGKTPAPRVYGASTPESFQRAQEQLERRRKIEADANAKRLEFQSSNLKVETSAPKNCPPSPDDDEFAQRQEEAAKRARSYSSVNSTTVLSPITSPSDINSPISSVALGSQEQIFPSVPSLPALISGASSVSADGEGDMLYSPGVCPPETVYTAINTPDTLTPSVLSKESSTGVESPITSDDHYAIRPYADTDEEGYNGDGDMSINADDDSDSDEGLTMIRKKPKTKFVGTNGRRGTNASVGSTDTAKKVSVDG